MKLEPRETGLSEEDLGTPLTFDDGLDSDLEAIDSSRPKQDGVWKRPSVYVAAFERTAFLPNYDPQKRLCTSAEMINTVIEGEVHLLSEAEKRALLAIRCLSCE